MNLLHVKNNSYDLFSNFLTHSFFSLLEQCYVYEMTFQKQHLQASPELIKAIKSFLFILKTSKNSLDVLDKQIFKYYIPYKYRTKSQILTALYEECPKGSQYLNISKSHLTLTRAKKNYIQTISHLKKNHEYNKIAICNDAFIKLYLCIIYQSFPHFSGLPDIFKAYTAKDFSVQMSHYIS